MGSIAVIAGAAAAAAARRANSHRSHSSGGSSSGASGGSTRPVPEICKKLEIYRYEHDPYVQPLPPSELELEEHKKHGEDPGIWENGILIQAYSD